MKSQHSKVSTTEKDIIRELVEDTRMAINTISRNIGRTRQTVSKNLKKLVDNNKLRFNTCIHKNILNAEFINIQIQLKNIMDIAFFKNHFMNCPRTVFLLYITTSNQLQVVQFYEKNEFNLEDSFLTLPIIPQMQSDSRISKLVIDPSCALLFPKFITIRKNLFSRDKIVAPCGKRCDKCVHHEKPCSGCPSTIYYKGSLLQYPNSNNKNKLNHVEIG
ncbi:MAG: winged helix-turn-helix transcriptional regulator [Candidatus Helarchaeota archaeon]